ncbi:MAG: prepilin-type N-terminal cleavage/methylation domain-containing protein [Planctomycetaceae bacterium]|nr:prepilin-type N-terminal cleavage/methylation domain-containing protein [Planctomycetaceae bacterium]
MRHHNIQSQDRPSARFGFTLTEMLVAVGLLLVIMTIFAQIFSLAVTAMGRQKGLANNDQRARTAFSIIDSDLKQMSFRMIETAYRPIRPIHNNIALANITEMEFASHEGIVPLLPGTQYNALSAAPQQQGYLYYSENDPYDPTDDVLQFTIDTTLVEEPGAHPGLRRYAGRQAERMYGRALNVTSDSSISSLQFTQRDQPDWDDGVRDNYTASTKAEVSYFLRNGNLYRRVLLLREDKGTIPQNMRQFDGTDRVLVGQPGYQTTYNDVGMVVREIPVDLMRYYTGNFYSDYDISAHYGTSPYNSVINSILDDPSPPSPPLSGNLAIMHSSLSNDFTSSNWPLGIPHFRFGYSPGSGFPREFVTDTVDRGFIGRYTHEETSNPFFQYPHATSGGVFGRTDMNIETLRQTGKVNVFTGHSPTRAGTDLLLSHVQAFDVEIWDASANGGRGGFVSINPDINMDFGRNSAPLVGGEHVHENTSWGPIDGPNLVNKNVLDTWHASAAPPSALGDNLPPNWPIYIHATSFDETNFNTPPDDVASTFHVDPYPINVPWARRWVEWTGASPPANLPDLTNGMFIFPSVPRDRTIAAMGDYVVWEAVFDPSKTILPQPLGQVQPTWNSSPDLLIQNMVNDPNDYNGNPADGPDVRWRPHDNRKPIRAMRVTVLFRDPTSNQMRQVTLVHGFNETSR